MQDTYEVDVATYEAMFRAVSNVVFSIPVEDTKMRFSLTPQPGESGFIQWLDAMKMVARLQGGIPPEFRKRVRVLRDSESPNNETFAKVQGERKLFLRFAARGRRATENGPIYLLFFFFFFLQLWLTLAERHLEQRA